MMLKRDKDLPGYAIGGLAGGESKDALESSSAWYKTFAFNKPRYLMGVGYPLDLVVCTSLGVDMYDCVYRHALLDSVLHWYQKRLGC